LREAILLVNAGATDPITFDLLGTGVHTFQPPNAYPKITAPVVIDGYSQLGSTANSDPTGFNGVLTIELDGRFVQHDASRRGLWLGGGGSMVRGLIINHFYSQGLFLLGGGGNIVQGNIIGTDAAGTPNIGNGNNLTIEDSGNLIGGTTPAARNIVSGQSFYN